MTDENQANEKQKGSSYNPIWLPIFTGVGVALGVAMDNLPIWLSVGLGIGLMLGFVTGAKKKS